MGEVYLVDHPRLPRYEALKIMPPAVSANVEFRQRFNREAELAAELWHPHIVSVHDRGEADGHLWITMDYVEGTDAGHFIVEQYPSGVPPGVAADIVTAVAEALDYAHGRGCLHRDVKPANILLSNPEARGRRILLSDFGLARELEDSSGLTATNMTVGSIHYAAPEQLMGQRLDGRADQYALGATAYHLLTGRPPFDNSKGAVVISHHLTTPPPLMATNRPDLGRLDAVIGRAMAKDPAGRFENCHEFARHFAEVVASEPDNRGATLVTPSTPAPSVSPPARLSPPPSTPTEAIAASAPKGSRRGLLIGAAIAAVLVVVAGAVLIPTLIAKDDETAGVAQTSSASAESAPATSAESAPAPGAVTPDYAPENLLDVAAMGDVMGIALAADDPITDHPSDTANTITPLDCTGAVATGTAAVYGENFTGVHITRYWAADAGATAYAEQTMVLTPTAEDAEQVLNQSLSQWDGCVGRPVTNTALPYTMTPGDTEALDNMITMAATVDGDGYGGDAYTGGAFRCQHTLGIWSNAIVEALVCDDTAPDDQSRMIVERALAATQQAYG